MLINFLGRSFVEIMICRNVGLNLVNGENKRNSYVEIPDRIFHPYSFIVFVAILN